MSNRLLFNLLLTLLSLPLLSLQAQKPFSSPYSRFGIGDLYRVSNCQTMALGGTGIALRHPQFVNFLNPASYTAFDSLSFVSDAAVTSNFQTLKTQDLSQSANYTTLKNLMFGLPLTHWWKSSFGLLPYSQIGYKVGEEAVLEGIGFTKKIFEGSGGFNQVYLGHAFQIHTNFSVGMNVSYLFGTLNRLRAITYPDSTYLRNFRVTEEVSVSDFLIGFGVQYYRNIGKNLRLTTGATFTNTTAMRAKETSLSETYSEGSTGIVYVKDTIENKPDVKGKITLPAAYGVGITLEKADKWLITADVRMQNWKKFDYFGEKDTLNNSLEAATGFQYIPNNNSLAGYLQKVSYRFGFRYNKTYLQLHSKQLEEVGLSFGVGLPLARTKSRVNLGMEVGKRGTTAGNLIQENFFRITLGISSFENWFYRPKFE